MWLLIDTILIFEGIYVQMIPNYLEPLMLVKTRNNYGLQFVKDLDRSAYLDLILTVGNLWHRVGRETHRTDLSLVTLHFVLHLFWKELVENHYSRLSKLLLYLIFESTALMFWCLCIICEYNTITLCVLCIELLWTVNITIS